MGSNLGVAKFQLKVHSYDHLVEEFDHYLSVGNCLIDFSVLVWCALKKESMTVNWDIKIYSHLYIQGSLTSVVYIFLLNPCELTLLCLKLHG